jgi:glutamate dehydrogenase
VLLSSAKMQLQGAIEASEMAADPSMSGELRAAFPRPMQERFGEAIEQHRLRREIIATKVANRIVNRLGIVAPFSLVEEEGSSFGQMAIAFVAAERLFGMADLWRSLDSEEMPEQVAWSCSTRPRSGFSCRSPTCFAARPRPCYRARSSNCCGRASASSTPSSRTCCVPNRARTRPACGRA